MQHTIQHLFQANSLKEVSRERLEELVTNYPSFSVGRYLLSRKLHAEQDGHFTEETQKTNLYFSNPFWLQWLLQNEEPVSARAALPDYGTPTVVEAPTTDGEEGNGVEPASGEIFFQEKLTVSEEAAPVNPEAVEPELEVPPVAIQTKAEDDIDPRVKELLEAVREEHKEGEETPTEAGEAVQVEAKENPEAPVSDSGTMNQAGAVPGSTLEEPAATYSGENREGRTRATLRSIQVEEPGVEAELKAANVSSAPLTAAEALLQHLAEARGLRQALVKMNEGEETSGLVRGENPGPVEAERNDAGVQQASTADNETQVRAGADTDAKEPTGVDIGTKEAIEPGNEVQRADGVESGAQQTAGTESEAQTGGQTPSFPVQEPSRAIVAHAMALAEPVVEFEPYHTIDYFASVGIKFVQEENPSDKLGKQLKSFTDWLKVMRKLPQKNQEIVPDMAAEHQIQAIAAHSIKGKEVVTETMAEVLVKQGMREKAVEVYHKLSLLNPDKSAYFAAKIEQLKID